MTIEEIEKLDEAEDIETDYKMKNRFLTAVNILGKYTDDFDIYPGHDQVWANLDDEQIEKMTLEDIKMMLKLGWFINEEAWSCFC